MSDPFAGAGEQVGSEFDPLFAGAQDAGIGERQAGFSALPSFPFYVFRVVKGAGNISQDKGTPSLRANSEVVEGPDGTVGRRTGPMDIIWLTVKRTNKHDEPLSDEKFKEKTDEFHKTYNRVKGALGLAGYPSSVKSLDSLDAYMAPTEGRMFIAELRQEIGNDKQVRNKLVAFSMESVDAPRTKKERGKTVVVPGTALDEAREKIKEYNDKALKASGTAGARKGSGPFGG